jgi:hypothetical protein
MRRALLTLSGLQLADICNGAPVMPRFGTASVKADIGSALHEYNALRGEKGRAAADAQADDIADRFGFVGKDRAIFFARARRMDLQIPEDALYEVPLCLLADGTVRLVEGGRGEYMVPDGALVAGTLDMVFSTPEPLFDGRLCPDGSVLWTPDLKTGSDAHVAPIAYNWQARASALLGSKWTLADAVVPAIVYPTADGGTWDVPMRGGDPVPLRAAELAEIERDVRRLHAAVTEQAERVAAGKLPRLVTGAHCTYCPARPACPAHVGEARALVTGDLTLLATPMTEEQLVRGAGVLGPTKAAAEKLEAMLRVHVNLHGPIEVIGGRQYGPVPDTKQVFHTRAAYQALRAELDPLVGEAEGERLADGAFTTSETAIKDAIRQAHKAAGIKNKLTATCDRIIAQEGVVSTVPTERWSVHYPRTVQETT